MNREAYFNSSAQPKEKFPKLVRAVQNKQKDAFIYIVSGCGLIVDSRYRGPKMRLHFGIALSNPWATASVCSIFY